MPKVSVIMNCYNGGAFVRQAIESVYAQSYTDWEIVFWDNCSTDDTADIAQSFDSKLRYFRGEYMVPLGAARNLALAKAEGDWIGFLDHDDLILPHRFARQMAAIGAWCINPIITNESAEYSWERPGLLERHSTYGSHP